MFGSIIDAVKYCSTTYNMETDLDPRIDVVFKRFLNKSSTSVRKSFFEERETAPSRYPVSPDLQLYSQANLIPDDAPADLVSISPANGTDDGGQPIKGSFWGKTSRVVPIVKRYVQIPLVAVPSNGKAFQSPLCILMGLNPDVASTSMLVIVSDVF